MKGRVHSIQSLGAVDGPGVRYVVFLQGCPLRCAYCHNPDTWDFSGGQEREAAELVQEICRYKMYFGDKGGVTVSGGEPLLQPAFVGELFRLLHGEGIHTALDTSGVWADWDGACQVLEHTDLILGDLKFATPEEYRLHCKADMEKPLAFYRLAEERGIPLWVRHVVVPGLNDSLEDMGKIKVLAESFSNLEKIEWLPFHNLCVEKYQSLGIPFPLAGTDNMDEEALQRLVEAAKRRRRGKSFCPAFFQALAPGGALRPESKAQLCRKETRETAAPDRAFPGRSPAGTDGPAEPAIQPTQKGPDLPGLLLFPFPPRGF